MNISEIYYTIQGEGILIGTPSVIVRFSGCNLNCSWCDTPNKDASDTIDKNVNILEFIKDMLVSNNCEHVIFTGGEPTLHQEDIKNIITYLKLHMPYKIQYTIETNATNRIAHYLLDCPLPIVYSLSPKLTSSGNRYDHQTLRRILTDMADSMVTMQLKLCIDLNSTDDLTDVSSIISLLDHTWPTHRIKPPIILQPVVSALNTNHYNNLYDYSMQLLRLFNWSKELSTLHKAPIRILPQLHKIIWGFNAGGV